MRAGVWFKALSRIDRVLVELTIQVTENIRSARLAKSLYTVVERLEGLLESRFVRLAKAVGRSLAEQASSVAQRLGNIAARSWATDGQFAFFLAVIHANK